MAATVVPNSSLTPQSPISRGDLERLLSNFRARLDQLEAAGQAPLPVASLSNGKCDAFALALTRHLEAIGAKAEIAIIERYTHDESDDSLVNVNNLSHVVVSFGKTTWDIQGPRAFERWSQDWEDESGKYTNFDLLPTRLYTVLKRRADKGEPFDMRASEQLLEIFNSLAGAKLVANEIPRRSHDQRP
jgi:hypothetical protein